MIVPVHYNPFENEEDYRSKGISWGLISEKAKVLKKEFLYKGAAGEIPAELIGYLDSVFAVIRLASGELHSIHPSFLKEMQAAKFVYPTLLPGGEPGIGDVPTHEDTAEVEVAGYEHHDGESTEPPSPKTTSTKQKTPSAAPARPKATESVKPPANLPDGKVKLTAIVERFDSRYDPFSESDQEIIVLEEVRWEPEAAEGFKAWSSLSATLKKADLQVGDPVTMEGKLAARKLDSEVAVKINNAAKIEKLDKPLT